MTNYGGILAFDDSTIRKHRKAWFNALESGDYKRVEGALCKVQKSDHDEPKGFCCLGVAQDLARVPFTLEHTVIGADLNAVVRKYIDKGEAEWLGTTGHLSKSAMAWLGVRSSDPEIAFPTNHARYAATGAELNDDGWSFKAIAKALRTYGFAAHEDLLRPEARELVRTRRH